jgi:hypothetical protein
MKMKVGDKVKCKRTLPTANGPITVEGEMYGVLGIDSSQVKINCHWNKSYKLYFIFSLTTEEGYYRYCDYFYNDNELRKLKLEKLNNI